MTYNMLYSTRIILSFFIVYRLVSFILMSPHLKSGILFLFRFIIVHFIITITIPIKPNNYNYKCSSTVVVVGFSTNRRFISNKAQKATAQTNNKLQLIKRIILKGDDEMSTSSSISSSNSPAADAATATDPAAVEVDTDLILSLIHI